ncbi:ATP-binding protein [Streptomyces sp. NRRL F-5126]|uniref:ATP-binding protein n=1 Tax=Streptomyces sp. NRRL F-5126 TaxID=1463857 RepID=UPI001F473BFD|nr:DUF234 domain-containing protein [Streptomyces sp. NRRL F-5126]
MTGRRRVGKSRLAQEFCDRAGAPYAVFQATRGRNPVAERADFVATLAQSRRYRGRGWSPASRRKTGTWLCARWRSRCRMTHPVSLSSKPVLLLLVGSDMSVMEALQSCGRPFFGRAAKTTVHPLNPADVRSMTGLGPAEAVDAQLVNGGFPEASYSRAVLEAVGSGERTFGTMAARAGGANALPSGTLSPLLATLQDKRVLAADLPLSAKPDSKNKRYRIADPYLRFWLAFLARSIPLIDRGRGDLALERIERSWTTWRGRAVEPLIRESLLRLMPDGEWPVGSVKWLENQPFDRHDYDALVRAMLTVPGTAPDTPLVAVSRCGMEEELPLTAHWGAGGSRAGVGAQVAAER